MNIATNLYDITPTGTFWLIGYGTMVESRKHPAEGVHDPIYANALLMEEDGHRVFVVNLDLVELESEYCDALRTHLAERFGLDERCILLSVTHNHQSVRDYHHSWETGEYNPAYEAFLTETIVRAYEELTAELAEFSAGIAQTILGIPCDQVLDVHWDSVQEVSWRIAYSMDEFRPYWEKRLEEADALLAAGDKSAKINGVSPFFFKKLVNKKLALESVDITLPSQIIALGDLVIVTSEGELASAFGRSIKAVRPDKCVLICGYTNGFQHYMMPAEEYGVGMESLDSVFPEGEVEHYIEAIESALARL